jgi:hypothetical protein
MMENTVWAVFHWGLGIAASGMIVLIVLIPLIGKLKASTSVRTEFYSARAAYWCVLIGLAIVLILSVSVAIRFSIISPIGGH